jgi:4-hydroxybenzoate polyprenyltransferase
MRAGPREADTAAAIATDLPAGTARTRRRRGTPALVLEAMRPRQWVKNAFVLAGLMFSGRAGDPGTIAAALLAFAAFCLASSAGYLVNDVVDAPKDRRNPRTAGRPIARGDLSSRTAYVAAALLALAALAGGAALNWATLGTIAGFLAVQVAYSYVLKHVLFVDVMAIAAGFVLRALGGAVAIDVVSSEWLLLCTGLLSIFLGFAKRRGEAVAMGGRGNPQRPVLDDYSVGLLDELIMVVAPSTMVSYALYAAIGAQTQLMLLTVPFVLYGIFRILYLIHHRATLPEDPSMIVWRDRPLQACIVLWGLAAGVLSLIA